MTERLTKLLSLQLRPHISAMLDEYVSRVRGKMPEPMQAKISSSLMVRKLLTRSLIHSHSLDYVNVGRKRDGAQAQLRIRLTDDEYAAVLHRVEVTGAPYSRLIAALIVEALHPDGNYPTNPDTKFNHTKDAP